MGNTLFELTALPPAREIATNKRRKSAFSRSARTSARGDRMQEVTQKDTLDSGPCFNLAK